MCEKSHPKLRSYVVPMVGLGRVNERKGNVGLEAAENLVRNDPSLRTVRRYSPFSLVAFTID
jgi:hypothetical protein